MADVEFSAVLIKPGNVSDLAQLISTESHLFMVLSGPYILEGLGLGLCVGESLIHYLYIVSYYVFINLMWNKGGAPQLGEICGFPSIKHEKQ